MPHIEIDFFPYLPVEELEVWFGGQQCLDAIEDMKHQRFEV
ncbi:unnamed protein product [marine sediment metagenome]|uniref:Uncharacterized protein n=1 Tax=marine sediment metagenome TaxID=412755 RepID=X1UCG7_9ZZZZ